MNDSQAQKKWTVMVYLAGDNNLSEDMVTALMGMHDVGSSRNVTITAYYDSVHPTTKTAYYVFPKPEDYARKPEGKPTLRECIKEWVPIGTYATEPDNTKALTDFVNWCVDRYPGEEYILILSGHGDGFRGRSLLYDENPYGNITLKQLRCALKTIKDKLGKELSILGFDSCFMSMLEVAYELHGMAGIIVSSQSNLPNSGWNYDSVLRELVRENGEKKPEYYAADFVEQFNKFNHNYDASGRSVDLNAIRLDHQTFESLGECIAELAECLGAELDLPTDEISKNSMLLSNPDEDKERIKKQVIKLILDAHWNSQTFMKDQAVDIVDFCKCLSDKCWELWVELVVPAIQECKEGECEINTDDPFEIDLKSEFLKRLRSKLLKIRRICSRTINAADDFVINSCYSGYEFQYSNGISLYFPWSYLGYYISRSSYWELEFVKTEVGKKWNDFIYKYVWETMRDPRDKIDLRSDPPQAKGDFSVYASYFAQTKNVPYYSGTPSCNAKSKALADVKESKPDSLEIGGSQLEAS